MMGKKVFVCIFLLQIPLSDEIAHNCTIKLHVSSSLFADVKRVSHNHGGPHRISTNGAIGCTLLHCRSFAFILAVQGQRITQCLFGSTMWVGSDHVGRHRAGSSAVNLPRIEGMSRLRRHERSDWLASGKAAEGLDEGPREPPGAREWLHHRTNCAIKNRCYKGGCAAGGDREDGRALECRRAGNPGRRQHSWNRFSWTYRHARVPRMGEHVQEQRSGMFAGRTCLHWLIETDAVSETWRRIIQIIENVFHNAAAASSSWDLAAMAMVYWLTMHREIPSRAPRVHFVTSWNPMEFLLSRWTHPEFQPNLYSSRRFHSVRKSFPYLWSNLLTISILAISDIEGIPTQYSAEVLTHSSLQVIERALFDPRPYDSYSLSVPNNKFQCKLPFRSEFVRKSNSSFVQKV